MIRILVLTALLLIASNAHAWLRVGYEDAVVVERSEVIVVGKIKADSVTCVQHEKKNEHDGRSWEHHATLVISEVIKGKLTEKEIPVIIHYGLCVAIGGSFLKSNTSIWRQADEKTPASQIDLHDTGSSGHSFDPIISAINENQIWFLRKRSGIFGREPGNGDFGVVDPEDVQLLASKDYFLTYLDQNPEAAVRKYVAAHPEFAKRTVRYFDHLEVQRAMKIVDVTARAKALLPYFAKKQYWSEYSCEAQNELIKCGDVAGKLLVDSFDERQFSKCRSEIMYVWTTMKYYGCVEVLINLLNKNIVYWSKQELKDDWWNAAGEEAKKRNEACNDVYHAVHALGELKDPRAREAVSLTLMQWRMINSNHSGIVQECERVFRNWR